MPVMLGAAALWAAATFCVIPWGAATLFGDLTMCNDLRDCGDVVGGEGREFSRVSATSWSVAIFQCGNSTYRQLRPHRVNGNSMGCGDLMGCVASLSGLVGGDSGVWRPYGEAGT